MVLDPIPQPLPVHFFGSRPQPPTSRSTLPYIYPHQHNNTVPAKIRATKRVAKMASISGSWNHEISRFARATLASPHASGRALYDTLHKQGPCMTPYMEECDMIATLASPHVSGRALYDTLHK